MCLGKVVGVKAQWQVYTPFLVPLPLCIVKMRWEWKKEKENGSTFALHSEVLNRGGDEELRAAEREKN